MYRRCFALARRTRADVAGAPAAQAEYKTVKQRMDELETWAAANKDFTDDQFTTSYMKIADQMMTEDPEFKSYFDNNSADFLGKKGQESFTRTVEIALNVASPHTDPKELEAASPVTRALVEIFQTQLSAPRPSAGASKTDLDRWWSTQSEELREIWDPFLYRTLLPAQVNAALDSMKSAYERLDIKTVKDLPQTTADEIARKWAAMLQLVIPLMQSLAVHHNYVNNIHGTMSFLVSIHRVLLVHPDLRDKQDAAMDTIVKRVFGEPAKRRLSDEEWKVAHEAGNKAPAGKFDMAADELALARGVCGVLAARGVSPLQAYLMFQKSISSRVSPAVSAQMYSTIVRRRAMEAHLERHHDPVRARELKDFHGRWEAIFKARTTPGSLPPPPK